MKSYKHIINTHAYPSVSFSLYISICVDLISALTPGPRGIKFDKNTQIPNRTIDA